MGGPLGFVGDRGRAEPMSQKRDMGHPVWGTRYCIGHPAGDWIADGNESNRRSFTSFRMTGIGR
jgi:hypothetical protein